MKGTVRLVWLLMTLTIVLTPMAWASPIDPSWSNGVYDGRDFDDVVSYLTSGTVAVPAYPAADVSPIFAPALTEGVHDGQPSAAPFVASNEPRAPPLS
jgi:hypothetical protein